MRGKFIRSYKKAKWNFHDSLFSLGLKSLSTRSNERIILLYHGITKNARTDINARFINTKIFEQEIRFFKENFNIVSISDYFKGASHPNKFTVALTFDDGYLNNFTEALPILEKYQVPATFYITTIRKANYDVLWADLIDLFRLTGPDNIVFQSINYKKGKHEYIGSNKSLKNVLKEINWNEKRELVDFILANNKFIGNNNFFPYFKLMNDDQIRHLSNSKFAEIGSHGLYHNCLNKISLEDSSLELSESKLYLEEVTQKEISSIAYPGGAYTKEILDVAVDIGYKTQLAVEYLYQDDSLDKRIQNRFGINPYISFNNQIKCIIDGKY